jgi:LPXTG-motif cell wall-anchored protein
MDEPDPDVDAPASYPIPEATIGGDVSVLAAILAAILGILFFWRRKKHIGTDGTEGTATEKSQ